MTFTPTLSQGEREPENLGMPESAVTPSGSDSILIFKIMVAAVISLLDDPSSLAPHHPSS
jgi:hypothetical protein